MFRIKKNTVQAFLIHFLLLVNQVHLSIWEKELLLRIILLEKVALWMVFDAILVTFLKQIKGIHLLLW